MLTRALLLTGTLLFSVAVNAQVFSRELGDFDLRMGTQPSHSTTWRMPSRPKSSAPEARSTPTAQSIADSTLLTRTSRSIWIIC